ncbi:hypothetical protein WDV93_08930 [Pantoea ananatis]
MRLYDLAESKIEQAMGQIKGVGDVSLMGSALPAVRIDLQPLEAHPCGYFAGYGAQRGGQQHHHAA